ncbi:MAG TPA: PAS domain S-box protein [Kiritimatiellia bacterium]|nr:PAS domain S-box protein [Kiritimatiellia bacterium]HPS06869.1 PAS domain S-box protein [Kiritimatiellia bacterium]
MRFNPFSRLADRSAAQIIVMASVMLLLVSAVVWKTARHADREMRDELLVQARMVKQAVEDQDLKTLAGSSEDVDKPAYKQIRDRFADLKETNSRYRFLYIMGRRANGQVFFYLDSENVNSELYAAPGEEYGEISAEDARVFDTKTAVVTGPSSDRWGTWVSALVPIIDPPTGAVAGVLGIDVDAHAWKWEVAARTALPVSLLLALVIVVIAGLLAFRPQYDHVDIKPIQQRLLVPLAAVLLLLPVGAGSLLVIQHRQSLNLVFRTTRVQLESDLNAAMNKQVGVMNALGNVVAMDPCLVESLKSRDRERLLKAYAPVFKAMSTDQSLARFALIGTDRVCLVRFHLPEKYGDRIERPTLIDAERSGAPATGLELEEKSFLVLRTVRPVYDGRTLVGYIEMGMTFDKIVDALDVDDGVEYAVAIRKEYLDRTAWEETLRQLGRPAIWDRFAASALIYATLSTFPADIAQAFGAWRPASSRDVLETSSGDQKWGVMTVPLKDGHHSEIGSLIALLNITDAKTVQARLRAVGLGGGLVLLVGLLSFLYVLLRRTDNSIRRQQLKLQKSEQRLSATLRSIGDGVITTDAAGRITDLNAVAERLTGWTTAEAEGRFLVEVFRIVNALTREEISNPVEKVIREETVVELANHSMLIAKDGTEYQIADSCAPIRDASQNVIGVVLVFRDVSEEYRRRAILRASEERYRAIFEKNASIQYLMNVCDGRIVDANPAACAFYGYTRERMKQLHISDINTMWQSKQHEILAKARTEGCPRFEFRHRLADGQIREVESYLCTLTIDGRECLYAVVHDITARKQTEAELNKEQVLVRTLMENVPEHIYFKDAESRFVMISRRQAEAFGLPDPALAVGKTDFDFFTEEHARPAFEAEQEIVRSGKPIVDLEEKETWPDGSATWVLTTKMPLRDSDGNIIGTFGVSHDITARKRIEQELRENEGRLRALTDAAQDAILMMDADGRISFWNPAAERIFGYAQDEVIGRDLHELVAPQRYRPAYQAGMARFQKTGEGAAVNTTIELQALRKTGEELPVELSLSALHLEGRWQAVGIIRDITEHKRDQEELIETNRQLNEAMSRANEMAEQARQASTAKSDFLANMSHEIRTPMNGVIGMTGLLLDTELTDEQRRYAETVRTSAESLLGLINDILDFSKIEAGKMSLEILDFDLQDLVEDLAATMALRAQDKGLELLYSIATEVPTQLRGDPGRLRQILTNLVSNAIKFTQAGEVAIRVMLESERMDSVLLRFSVRDTGIGIPEEKIGLLFEKFMQADTSTTRKYGGTGLGLAICKQLAELMDGEVSVVSEEGKGSEFSVTARFGKQAEGAQPVVPVSADLRHVRILVVDDNATSREILTTYMTSWGMRPAETSNGPSAIQMLLRAVGMGDPFQLAVLDMQMPVMDGEMLGQAIKADARIAGTRLVMLTSLGMRDNAAHFQLIGFEACLTKPARHQELKRALSLALMDKATKVPQSATKRQGTKDLQAQFADIKARILLAEDNITNQQVALGILKKLGLRADAVANGAEAIKELGTVPYDLVLMDVQMPVLDGLEATRQIRAVHAPVLNRDIPIVAMTAHAMQGDQEKCLAAGMNDYVSKPVTPQALARVLERWLRKKEHANTGTAGNVRQSAAEPLPSVWDLAGLMERVMDDKDLAQQVLAGFPEDVGQRLLALKACFDAGNLAGVERQAHAINGAAGIIGGEALRAEASAMEKAARTGDRAGAAARYPELIRRFEGLKEALESQLKTWRGDSCVS